ncbi:MAG: phosphotransferase family protein [Phycisphaerales bacterium]
MSTDAAFKSGTASADPGGDVGDGHSLAVALAPALMHECGGRLSTIEWFRSTWQRGGSATGFAHWREDAGRELDVLVKLPVGPVEHRWTTRLGAFDPGDGAYRPTPRVVAAGRAIGGYDLGWLVIERLDGHTLNSTWNQESLESLLRAAARLQRIAVDAEPVGSGTHPPPPNWELLVERARDAARGGDVPDAQKWNDALKRLHRALPRLSARWDGRAIGTWCHGDLHPGNAMRRPTAGRSAPDPGCVLIDLAFMHAGHWVEDAVYLERQFWSHPEQLFGVHPVSLLAKYRREQGLHTDDDYGSLANVRRVLMAACVPAFVAREGSPRYVHAALEALHRLMPQVGA